MKRLSSAFGVALLLAAMLSLWPLAGCRTVPETGRSQFSLVSESQISQEAAAAFTQMKSETPLSTDPERNAQAQRVGRRIVEAARQSGSDLPPPEQWEFVVFEDDNVNAFAMPGGKVGIFTGMYRVARNDDELAVVMGHEVAHVAVRHGSERVSRALAIALGGAVLGVGLSQTQVNTDRQQAVLMAYGVGTAVGAALPYSRQDESEADRVGLLYMARAGYDPHEAIPFWQRMHAEAGGAQPPEFLSTHPAADTRIRDLQAQMPQASAEYQRAQAARPSP